MGDLSRSHSDREAWAGLASTVCSTGGKETDGFREAASPALPRVAGASLTRAYCVRSILSLGGLRGSGFRDGGSVWDDLQTPVHLL